MFLLYFYVCAPRFYLKSFHSIIGSRLSLKTSYIEHPFHVLCVCVVQQDDHQWENIHSAVEWSVRWLTDSPFVATYLIQFFLCFRFSVPNPTKNCRKIVWRSFSPIVLPNQTCYDLNFQDSNLLFSNTLIASVGSWLFYSRSIRLSFMKFVIISLSLPNSHILFQKHKCSRDWFFDKHK